MLPSGWGRYDDEKLGFQGCEVLLLPGVVGRRSELDLFVNIKQWGSLAARYKAIPKPPVTRPTSICSPSTMR